MLPSDPPFQPPVATLETTRLSIRIDTEQSYVHAFRNQSDEELIAYFGIPDEAELRLQQDKVRGGLSTYRTSVVFFHLKERSEDKVIGNFAFHNWYPAHRRSEIGYATTSAAHKGCGYMREAIGPILAFGFGAMELNRMEAFIHPENAASLKLVQRAGFRREGLLTERYIEGGAASDSLAYGLLLRDYAAESAG